MRVTSRLLSIALASALASGCDDGEERRPVEDEARRLISIEADRSTSDVGAPILLRVTVYSTNGERLPGQHVTIRSSRPEDVLSVEEGMTDDAGEFVSTLTATAAGKRSITAYVGASSGTISLVIGPSWQREACAGRLLLGGSPPAESVPDERLPYLVTGDFDADGACEAVFMTEGSAPTWAKTLFTRGAAIWPEMDYVLEAGWSVHGFAAGDFDGDGRIELVVASSAIWETEARVEWFSADTERNWQRIARLDLSGGASRPIATDVDGDGRLDLLVQTYKEGAVRSVFLTGDGPVLGEAVTLSSDDGQSARTWTAGDFDGDGKADLAIDWSDQVSILAGNGDGTFRARETLDARYFGPIAADLDGDGLDDLAGLEKLNGKTILTVFRSRADGSFERVPVSESPSGALRAADVDGDGVLDLLIASGQWLPDSFDLLVVRGDREGGFASPERWMGLTIEPGLVSTCESAAGQTEIVLLGQSVLARIPVDERLMGLPVRVDVGRPSWLGDLEGDGSVGIVTVGPDGTGRQLAVEADGTTRTVQAFEITRVLPGSAFLAVGRVGDDPSIIEIGVRDRLVSLVVHSLSTGASREFATRGDVQAIAVVDLDGDGLGDIVYSTWDETVALLADGEGGFRVERAAAFGAWAIAAGDLDGDGSLELILADWPEVVALSAGPTFGAPSTLTLEMSRTDGYMFTGDFDGDGMDDIAIGGRGDTISIFLHGADGQFEPALEYGVGGRTHAGAYGRLAGSDVRDLAFLEDGRFARVVPITCEPLLP